MYALKGAASVGQNDESEWHNCKMRLAKQPARCKKKK